MEKTITSERSPVVYITQIPMRKDRETGAVVPIFNIAPAAEHGEISVLMPNGANFFSTSDLVRQLKDRLKDYDPEQEDAIIALGDPSIIAACAAIIAKKHNRINLCKWDRIAGRYIKVEVNL